ncbi:unnamed protein product [Aphanomyces euteiches]
MTDKIGSIFKTKTEKAYLDVTDSELTAMLLEAASSPALQDNLAVVRSLLTHGANVNSTDKHGNTPLYWASLRGHLETVKELLSSGARADISNHVQQYFAVAGKISFISETKRRCTRLQNMDISTL